MEFDKIIELIHAVSESELTEFQLQNGEWKISMETDKKSGENSAGEVQQGAGRAMEPAAPSEAEHSLEDREKRVEAEAGNVIKSPLVGTFYRSSSPEAAPFVQAGDIVKKGQVLGIVEAMKLMNEIESEFDGIVKEIRAENEQMVEYGQPLFVIE